MRKTFISIVLAAMCASGAVAAQQLPPIPTNTPPVAPPTKLPPLPGGNLPPVDMPSPLPLPNPVPPTGQTPEIAKGYSGQDFFKNLITETERLNNAIDNMDIVLLATDQDAFKQQKSKGRFSSAWTRYENNLALLTDFVPGNSMNSFTPPTCFVALDMEKAEDVFKKTVQPLEGKTHPQTFYAYALAHATAHCLDLNERMTVLRSGLSWKAIDAEKAGLFPNAVRGTYGERFSKDSYLAAPQLLNSQPMQHQYEERAADAFAVAWTMKMGGDYAAIVDMTKTIQKEEGAASTLAATDLMRKQENEIQRLSRVDLLWDLARLVQRKVGADTIATSTPEQNFDPKEVVRYVVTAQGLVGVNARGQVVSQPQNPANTSRTFNDLPRFGRQPQN